MAKSLYLLIAVATAFAFYDAKAADEEKPYGRVCISVVDGPAGKEEAKKLVTAMQAPKMDERLLAMQTNKLRELIGRITSEKEKVNQAPMTDPEVGGVFRGAGDAAFPWRQFAQSINFGDDRPGVLVL